MEQDECYNLKQDVPSPSRSGSFKDLQQHFDEHQKKIAFTYTILNEQKDRCVGYLYIRRSSSPLFDLRPAELDFWKSYIESLSEENLPTEPNIFATAQGMEEKADNLLQLYLLNKKTEGSGLVKYFEQIYKAYHSQWDLRSHIYNSLILKTFFVKITTYLIFVFRIVWVLLGWFRKLGCATGI